MVKAHSFLFVSAGFLNPKFVFAEREKRLKHREEQKWALENPELAWQVGITLRNGEIDGDNGEKQQSELK